MAAKLQRAGYRLTEPRLAVLRVLRESAERLSYEELHQRARGICPRIGLVTVYRTIELFEALGMVRRVHAEPGCHGWALAGQNHHHVVCQECQHVVEFPCPGLEQLVAQVEQETGYRIQGHLLELAGVCPACQQQAASRPLRDA
jgi:Fur family ferric uptake transcriptional regulator